MPASTTEPGSAVPTLGTRNELEQKARLAVAAWQLPVIYGAMHALVDAVTVTVAFAVLSAHRVTPYHAFYLVLTYDLVAFGSQALFGAWSDKLRSARTTTLAGLGLTALALMTLPLEPISATVLAGLGNAAFHVGAGTISLRIVPNRAWAPGVFVGPGALGLGFGIWFGKSGLVITWPFAILLAAAFVVTLRLPDPPHPHHLDVASASRKPCPSGLALPRMPWAPVVVSLLLFSILIRSMVGFAGSYQVPKGIGLLIGLSTAACAGKMLGGFIADRIGWLESSVGALLLSAPLIAFGGQHAVVIVAGMLLFQMTMPVTLAAVALAFPRWPGFAFGLTCLALIIGAVPTFYPFLMRFYGWPSFLGAIVLSASVVFLALHLMGRANPVPGRWCRATADSREERCDRGS